MSIESIIAKLHEYEKAVQRQGLIILEQEAKHSVMLNFIAQGRPDKWAPKKFDDGRAILTGKTGNLQGSIIIMIDEANNRILMGTSLIYGPIQNDGGTIRVPARNINFRETRDGRNVFARKNRKGSFHIPAKAHIIEIKARPYLVVPPEDYPRIISALEDGIKLAA